MPTRHSLVKCVHLHIIFLVIVSALAFYYNYSPPPILTLEYCKCHKEFVYVIYICFKPFSMKSYMSLWNRFDCFMQNSYRKKKLILVLKTYHEFHLAQSDLNHKTTGIWYHKIYYTHQSNTHQYNIYRSIGIQKSWPD